MHRPSSVIVFCALNPGSALNLRTRDPGTTVSMVKINGISLVMRYAYWWTAAVPAPAASRLCMSRIPDAEGLAGPPRSCISVNTWSWSIKKCINFFPLFCHKKPFWIVSFPWTLNVPWETRPLVLSLPDFWSFHSWASCQPQPGSESVWGELRFVAAAAPPSTSAWPRSETRGWLSQLSAEPWRSKEQ